MNNPRANIANLIAAGGAGVLILSLFISWFGSGDESRSAFGVFSLADIVLFLIGIVAAALAAAHITGQAASLPGFLRPSILKWLGTVALTISLMFAIEFTSGDFGADLKIGAILGVLASAAILVGGILNDRPELAARLNEATAGIGSGGGPGAGSGGPAAPGAGGHAGGVGGGQPGGIGGGQPGGAAPAAAAPAPSAPAQQPSPPQDQPQTAAQPVQSPSPAAQPAQAESSGPAPGWYPDPQGQKRLRYWDGGRWTEQTAD